MKFTLGRPHGSQVWQIIYGPQVSNELHRAFLNMRKFAKKDRTYAQIVQVSGGKLKTFNQKAGQEFDSSSSASSGSSSSSLSSATSQSSVNSSLSSSSSLNSSSSSSSTESSSSSS